MTTRSLSDLVVPSTSPTGWEPFRFGHLFSCGMGNTIIREELSEDGSIPVLSATEEDTLFGHVHRASVLLSPGDLAITARGTIGRVKLIRFRCTLTQTNIFARATSPNRVKSAYTAYYLSAFREVLFFHDKTAIPQLTVDQVRNNIVLVPPLRVQDQIVRFLDHKTAAIDALISKKKRLIELLQEKRQALITQAVTKGLDPTVPMKDSGFPWLGIRTVPAHWALRRLKHLSHRISGRLVYQPAQYFSDDGVPFIMGNNVTERGLVLIDTKYIPTEVNARFAHHALCEGDVVMVRVGAPGVTAVVGRDAAGLNCGSLMIVRRNPKFDSRWLAAVMNSPLVRAQIDLVQYGAAQEQINISDAVNFWFPTPPLEEQLKIAEFVATATRRIDVTSDKVREQVGRLREYRQALITAAVTGKLDVSTEAA